MTHRTRFVLPIFVSATLIVLAGAGDCRAAAKGRLYVGWATTDITPPRPVALVGQMTLRVSQKVDDPLTATVLALETRSEDGKPIEQAIMISCDLCMIRQATQDRLKKLVKPRLEDFDADKLFLGATHTHTAPGQEDGTFGGLYDVSKVPGAMKASEYAALLTERLADAVVKAWNARRPGGMSWGLGQAVVGHNRRAVYLDGHAQMYGDTNQEGFDRIEGYEDHGVPLLFFFNENGDLTGMVINVACPSQETENLSTVSADFWHEVRGELAKRYSKDVAVLAQCGAAGDVSPHLMFRKQAEQVMLQRKGISRRQEIALRIADAVDRVFPYAKKDVRTSIVFAHTVARVNLPTKQPPSKPFYQPNSVAPVELHVLRLGETVLATNPFELYVDYGLRIQARSKAALTFVAQLCCEHCGYLPTAQAVKGGGYSAENYVVGPEGGQVLVNETVKRINALWQ